jgi:type I restriction enzyme S subunit
MVKYKLGDICEIVTGSTPKTGVSEYWDGDLKWITPAEIDDDSYIINDSVRKITELGAKKTGLSSFPEGTVILSSRAPIGKVAIAGCEMYCNQGFKNLICSDQINNRYLYWFLKGKTRYLNSLGRGATFKEISKQIVAGIEVNVPDKKEQLDVVDELEKISHIIRSRKQEIQKLDELIKARFVEMFGDPEFNNKKWNIEKLEKLCLVGSSKRIYQNEQSTEGVPFLRISDLINRMDTGKKACDLYIPVERFLELKEQGLVPQTGDILLTARGTLGRCYIIKNDDKFYFQDGMITWLSNFDDRVTALYISFLFSITGFRKQIDALQAGSTVAYLSIAMTKKLDVMIPPIELQNQFADFVVQVDKSKLLE